MQSPKKAFAALCMHQGHATVRSGSHIGGILNKSASWAGIPGSRLILPCPMVKCLIALDTLLPEGLLKTSNMLQQSQVQGMYKVHALTRKTTNKPLNCQHSHIEEFTVSNKTFLG